MATVAWSEPRGRAGESFYFWSAIAMALFVLAGFTLHWLLGRSTFLARPLVHVHALVFMGWVALFTAQAWLGAHGPRAAHRQLGRIAAGWVILMLVFGLLITLDVIRRGATPAFFQPQHFLVGNPLNLMLFALIVAAAVRLRKRRDWHMRLQLCAMASLMGPAFGRLLPGPLFVPYAWDVPLLLGLVFPLAGIARDLRREGRVHPAWIWGMLAIAAVVPLTRAIAFSPAGDALYKWVTAGYPGASIPGLALVLPPPM